jgi:hypothetical protein
LSSTTTGFPDGVAGRSSTTLLFIRVCGGRTGAKADVEFEGDAEVGQRIVANLAYVS